MLVGHVDTRTGPDVFYRLRKLRPGDEILVGRPDGTTARFLVGRLERHPKTALPTSRIWTPTSRRQLWLITCAGIWDDAIRHYRDNLIVYASPTGNSHAGTATAASAAPSAQATRARVGHAA